MSETRDDEQRAAEALARALEAESGGTETDAEAEVAELLQVAERVRASAGFAAPLGEEARDSILDEALEQARPRRRPRLLRLFAGGMAAAAVILVVAFAYWLLPRPASLAPDQVAVTAPAPESEAFAAPTDALFDGPFAEDQSPAERMDRIVQARTRGYFAALMMKRSSSPVRTASVMGSLP